MSAVGMDEIPKRLSLAERAMGLGGAGGGGKLPCGVALIDRNARGGLRRGLTILGGEPGAGKTTLAVQIAINYAHAGIQVAILAADEGADGIMARIGQSIGFDRDAIEEGSPETREKLAESLRPISNLVLVDGSDAGASVGQVADELIERAKGQTAVLIVDSIQRCRARGTDEAADLRLRANAVVEALVSAGRRGVIVIATSELNRGAYGPKAKAKRVDDLASFKESGAVEYGADFAVLLRCDRDAPSGHIDVAIAKSRWSKTSPRAGRLALDSARATFGETAAPAERAKGIVDPAAQLAADVAVMRGALKDHPGVAGNEALTKLVGGMSKDRKRAALKILDESGEIANRGTPRRPALHLVPPAVLPSLSLPEGELGRVRESTSTLPESPPLYKSRGNGGRVTTEGVTRRVAKVRASRFDGLLVN